ncbi:MAG: penicillin acylase family protein [Planctomycetes bacterium]|nr:penicillin acylase family protein [Planctomycetota bacterium]
MKTLKCLVIGLTLGLSSLGSNPTAAQQSTVTIHRDAQGIAHVFATEAEAAWYGFGLSQFRDLPVTTMRNLVVASAEAALYLGPGHDTGNGMGLNVSLDLRERLWRIEEIADRQEQVLPEDIERLLTAYAAGLDAGRIEWSGKTAVLANNTAPESFDQATVNRLLSRPIRAKDVLRLGVHVNALVAMNVAHGLAGSDDPKASESTLRRASNSFAIGIEASLENAAMTVADPHLEFESIPEFRSYFGQISQGNRSIAGISFPGFPAIAMGFSDELSWAITSNNPDYVDVWRAPSSGFGKTFLFDGQQKAIIDESVVIDVWDPNTGLITSQTHQRSYAGSHSRPIVRSLQKSGPQGQASPQGEIFYAGSTFDSDHSLWEFFIRLGQAHDTLEALRLFELEAITGYNFLIADRGGNLGYIWSGRLPRRGSPTPGTTWSMVQDGSLSAYQWQDVHPVSELPVEYLARGAAEGAERYKWLQCNCLPDTVRPDTDMDLSGFPSYMVHPDRTPFTWRQLRGRELLGSRSQLSAQDLRDFAIDDLDLWWRSAWPLVKEVADEFVLWKYPNIGQTLELMADWDLATDPTRSEPLISHLVRAAYDEGLRQLVAVGRKPRSLDLFDYPDELPSLAEWQSNDWDENRQVMAAAILRADDLWRSSLNPLMPALEFAASPWTPMPFAGLPHGPAVWGSAHYLHLTPASWATSAAAYPVAGNISMLALGSSRQSGPADSILQGIGILGQVGELINVPLDSGAHNLLQVTLRRSGAEAWFLQVLGPSEVTDDPDRYASAADFAAGTWRRLLLDEFELASTSTDSQVLAAPSFP